MLLRAYRTQVTFGLVLLCPKNTSSHLTFEPGKGLSLRADDIGRQRPLTQPRPSRQLPVVFGLQRERRIASPLSRTTLYPCHKITNTRIVRLPTFSKPRNRLPMPKNTVSDPITDQEMAFAHLILSGTMNDRRAAEAVGLNPDTAAYTKSKPRVRAYMIEHRAAVRERLVDQEAEGLRQLNLGRDQILARLWELANLSPEATRGTIAGQVKALAMIVAIEGLIPSGTMNARRLFPTRERNPRPRPSRQKSTRAEWRREQQHQPGPASHDPGATTRQCR